MADKDFDRGVINPRERPVSTDILQEASQRDRTLRDLLRQLLAGRTSASNPTSLPKSGFVGSGFACSPGAGLQVLLAGGLGFVDDASDAPASIGSIAGLNDLSPYKPLLISATTQAVTVATPPGVNSRIDLIEAKVDRRLENSANRDVFDPAQSKFVPTVVNKTLAFDSAGRTVGNYTTSDSNAAGICYKLGTAAASPTIPTTSPGYAAIAAVIVDAGAASITAAKIIDLRKLLSPGGTMTVSGYVSRPTTGGAVAPTLTLLSCPPGVKVGVKNLSTVGSGQLTIGVIAGALTNGVCVASAQAINTTTGIPVGIAAGVQTESSGNVADWNDAAKTGPAALGTNTYQTMFEASVIPATSASLNDPTVYSFIIHLS